jgi:hypothetical protein
VSCQNLMFKPIPTSNLTFCANKSHPRLMCFHNPTPKCPKTSFEHYPPSCSSYFSLIILYQSASLSVAYLYSHFPDKALLNLRIFRMPRPPALKGWQTWSQLTRCIFGSCPIPPYKKSIWIFSILLATLTGTGNKDK